MPFYHFFLRKAPVQVCNTEKGIKTAETCRSEPHLNLSEEYYSGLPDTPENERPNPRSLLWTKIDLLSFRANRAIPGIALALKKANFVSEMYWPKIYQPLAVMSAVHSVLFFKNM